MVLESDFDFGKSVSVGAQQFLHQIANINKRRLEGDLLGGTTPPQPQIDPLFRTLDLFNVWNFHLLLVWVYILLGRRMFISSIYIAKVKRRSLSFILILSYASEEKEVIYGVVFDGQVMVALARLGAKLKPLVIGYCAFRLITSRQSLRTIYKAIINIKPKIL